MSADKRTVKLKITLLYLLVVVMLLILTEGLIFPVGGVLLLFNVIMAGVFVQLFCAKKYDELLAVWYGKFTSTVTGILLTLSIYQFSNDLKSIDIISIMFAIMVAIIINNYMSRFSFKIHIKKNIPK